MRLVTSSIGFVVVFKWRRLPRKQKYALFNPFSYDFDQFNELFFVQYLNANKKSVYISMNTLYAVCCTVFMAFFYWSQTEAQWRTHPSNSQFVYFITVTLCLCAFKLRAKPKESQRVLLKATRCCGLWTKKEREKIKLQFKQLTFINNHIHCFLCGIRILVEPQNETKWKHQKKPAIKTHIHTMKDDDKVYW